jgi:hypothetical protein
LKKQQASPPGQLALRDGKPHVSGPLAVLCIHKYSDFL